MKKSDEKSKSTTEDKHKHHAEKNLKEDKIFGSSPSHKLVFPKKDKVKKDDDEPVVKKDDKKDKEPKDNSDEKSDKNDKVHDLKEKVTELEKIADNNDKEFKKAVE